MQPYTFFRQKVHGHIINKNLSGKYFLPFSREKDMTIWIDSKKIILEILIFSKIQTKHSDPLKKFRNLRTLTQKIITNKERQNYLLILYEKNK